MSKKDNIFAVHANYARHAFKPNNDLVMVKEHIISPEGQVTNNLRFFENFKRDFYVTKKRYRKHTSKKISEDIKKCDKFSTNQAMLDKSIAKALNCKVNKTRTMARSPYLYGTDVHVTNIILRKYRDTYGDAPILPTVAVMDYEWDVDTQCPTIGAMAFEQEVNLVVLQEMVSKTGLNTNQYIHAIREGFSKHVQPLIDEALERLKLAPVKFTVNVEVVELDFDVIRRSFFKTHKLMPDYLAFWNGEADLDVITAQAERYGVELYEFMNDPIVPDEYRHTKFLRGADKTVDANGNPKPKTPSERWHVLDNMASWQFIDMMCCYNTNRAHLAKLPSYALDPIMKREIGMGKLKLVEQLAHLEETDMADWHRQMSHNHFVEYSLYATIDVIAPLILEMKSFEISSQAYSEIDINPIGDFKKNPRKLCNSNHFSYLKEGHALAATSDQMTEEIDKNVYSSSNWIVTLNSSYHDTLETAALADSSAPVLYIPSCDDGDLTSSYPSNQRALNMDKGTTLTEVSYVNNIPEELMREIGLDISSCGNNSIDFCYRILGYPHLTEILAKWDEANK